MAPLNPDAVARSNTLPIATFGAQALFVAYLTSKIWRNIRRAARALPVSSTTRAQDDSRRRQTYVFSTLALLSLASVTTFSVMWRVLSYFEWAVKGNHESSGSLWSGWYGTSDYGVGSWRLGDWYSDVDLKSESDRVALGTTEGFMYTSQHFVGLVAVAMFVGIEGRRRNLGNWTIASFIFLSGTTSLAFALNLFFVTILFTPVAAHNDDTPRHNALFTPKPAVYYIPIIGSFLMLNWLPSLILRDVNVSAIRLGYYAVPIFLAYAPQIIPLRWGQQHASKTLAHRSFVRAFYVLGFSAFVLSWKTFADAVSENTPRQHAPVYDLFMNAIGKHEKHSRFLTALGTTAHGLKVVSRHPAISVTGWDVGFTTLSLLAWTFVRNLEVNEILENSVLSFLGPPKAEKHVAFKDNIEDVVNEVEEKVRETVPKKRGRPRKSVVNGATVTGSPTPSSSSSGTLRRSTRRKFESEAEEAYEPTAHTANEAKRTESDGASMGDDLVSAGESTALALFLTFVGGLGQLAASTLGAEATSGSDHPIL